MMKQKIQQAIAAAIDLKKSIFEDEELFVRLQECVEITVAAIKQGNQVLFCGNGGSAADAQHLAAELAGRFYKDRSPIPAEALHCNTSYLTAVANDYSYAEVYSRIVQGRGRPGDILIGLSTSGNSANVVLALQTAKSLGITTIAFTGAGGGKLKAYADYLLAVPSRDTPRIQEVHIMLGHIYCQLIEELLFPDAS